MAIGMELEMVMENVLNGIADDDGKMVRCRLVGESEVDRRT